MSFALLVILALGLGLAFATVAIRRREVAALAEGLAERRVAVERGSHRARLQYPHVDLTRCFGCGACVRACPEEGVLEVLHGQAVVVHGARCVGHGRCATECPTGAISITLGDLAERRDIPALEPSLEAVGTPGLFLAGEVTGHALVRTAIAHGIAVAAEIGRRMQQPAAALPARARAHASVGASRGAVATEEAPMLDVLIVGAGPAGIACALGAKERGLTAAIFEQEALGGTVAKYPRRKLVMTQPIELPLVGKLSRDSYTKEQLMLIWERIVSEQELDLRAGETFLSVVRQADGHFIVTTSSGEWHARYVCLALGRRGSPRKLGVPGEELSKVSYSLLDAESYLDRRILVVGGGDSAVEAALGLAEQQGNRVTLSYRKNAFSRLKARNEARLRDALAENLLEVVFESEVARIENDHVELTVGPADQRELRLLDNDEVFILAGGVPAFELLERNGVSFDPADRVATETIAERGSGLMLALGAAFAVSLLALIWVFFFRGYYTLPSHERIESSQHAWLRPSAGIGLVFGVIAAALILTNLAYLIRRHPKSKLQWGSLRAWMTSHVATGILSLVFALAHSAFDPRHTVGGHALILLAVLLSTGAIGRYFYAYVPRAANGRELALEEINSSLAGLSGEWDQGQRGFGERARLEVQKLVEESRWQSSFFARLGALLRSQSALRACLSRLAADARAEGLPKRQIAEMLELARRAHRASLMAAHYEDLRALLASWRYVHRWVALLMVLLVAWHVYSALRFASIPGVTP